MKLSNKIKMEAQNQLFKYTPVIDYEYSVAKILPGPELRPIVTKELANIQLTTNFSCRGCGLPINDRYLLQVDGFQFWHLECLRCVGCSMIMEQMPKCYVRDEQAFCKQCYHREYGVKCARCQRIIQPQDWVRRARHFVYHLACFACDNCKRQLSTGEEFALQDSRVLCKTHYMELIDGDTGKSSQKQKTKRIRTTFSEEQLHILQTNFQIDSNPDGQDLERIAQMTGLSKRVTQVWFQNSRARQKKYQVKGSKQCHRITGVMSPTMGSDEYELSDNETEYRLNDENGSMPDSTTTLNSTELTDRYGELSHGDMGYHMGPSVGGDCMSAVSSTVCFDQLCM